MGLIDTGTRLCAVIGNPVAHSLSPHMHNAAFEAAGLNYVYLAFRVEDVGGCIEGMRALPSFRGMSVTIPHKIEVMRHLDEIEPMAQHVGSVNTVTNENGRLVGSTTDGPGTLRAFIDAKVDLNGKKVLFVGSGGAVRAVAFAIAELTHADHVTILGRTPERVAKLVNDLRVASGKSVDAGGLDTDLAEAMRTHDVVIQGTPVGMHPHEDASPVPAHWLRDCQVVFDMVYRPHKTMLLRDAEAAGCKTIVGIEMLINQAVLQFERWTGVEAPYAAMRDAALKALASPKS